MIALVQHALRLLSAWNCGDVNETDLGVPARGNGREAAELPLRGHERRVGLLLTTRDAEKRFSDPRLRAGKMWPSFDAAGA